MRHLSDDLIQSYLDTPILTDHRLVESHVLVCFECREKLERYQELYQHLAVESEAGPDESFQLNILAAVDRMESKKKLRRLVQFCGAFSLVALLVCSLSYFGLIKWQTLFSAVPSLSTKLFSPLSQTFGLLVEKLNGNLELLAFAGLALLLFQLLDYGLIKNKVNRT